MKAKANEYQVGGDHYIKKADGSGEQHWDMIWRLYGSGYFVGCITKYVLRYRDKNGLQDLEKARHYLEKLIELERGRCGDDGGGGWEYLPPKAAATRAADDCEHEYDVFPSVKGVQELCVRCGHKRASVTVIEPAKAVEQDPGHGFGHTVGGAG